VRGASNAAISGIQISGPVQVGGQVTFAQPPIGTFSVDWNSGVSNRPAAYKVVPGQHRPLRAKIGVNTWYDCYTSVYGYCITNIANQFISWGLRDAGWVWIGIDDGWHTGRDATTHRLVPDPGKYPQGMRALTDGIHSMGFKIGLYTSFPYCGAPNYPSTANYPVQDAQAMCDWNVDCLKFDGVGSASWMSTFYDTVQTLYLSNSRAPLYIETYCTPTDGFGVYQDPRLKYWATSQLASRDWSVDVGYFLSRFESELGAAHDYFSSFVPAGGLLICTNVAGVPPTNAYNAVKAQMSVLAMLSADMVANRFNPGYASNYLYMPPAEVLTAMKNTNVLAVHQDPAQVTGWPIIHDANKVVWLKPLGSVDGPEWAVTIWNPSTTAWSTNTFGMTNLPGLFTGTWRAVELWSMTTQIVSTVITCTNVPYEPKMYRLTPTWMY
jgi:alpha-galactosidase